MGLIKGDTRSLDYSSHERLRWGLMRTLGVYWDYAEATARLP